MPGPEAARTALAQIARVLRSLLASEAASEAKARELRGVILGGQEAASEHPAAAAPEMSRAKLLALSTRTQIEGAKAQLVNATNARHSAEREESAAKRQVEVSRARARQLESELHQLELALKTERERAHGLQEVDENTHRAVMSAERAAKELKGVRSKLAHDAEERSKAVREQTQWEAWLAKAQEAQSRGAPAAQLAERAH